MTIEDGGNTLHLQGNSWKKISIPYTITPYTVLEFDFRSTAQGEVHGIGFDNNETMSDGYTYKLYGTQSWGIDIPFYRYATFAPNYRHYRIPVGERFTGNMLYLVFVNDHDVSNPTAESYFSNVQVFEDSQTPAIPPVNVDFNAYTISPLDSPALTMTIEDGGSTMHMQGNGWLKIFLPYNVSDSTVIEFDYKSGVQGQVQGILFNDVGAKNEDRTFELYGTQGYGRNAVRYDRYATDWKHFRIPVGKYYTGSMNYVIFANDQDVSTPTADGYFRNVVIYEGEVTLPVTVNFNEYALSPYSSPLGGSNPPNVSIEDNGNTLHLTGNGWLQISMPVLVSQNTVLEFDFKSNSQGEIHGLGLDIDQSADPTHTFKLYGTQSYGVNTFNDYTASAPNWKHYSIPVGQYYFGQMLYLFFANDYDVDNPNAESYFANVEIHLSIPVVTPTPSGMYDRSAAVAYADEWAHSRNLSYPLWYTVQINCGCNDCTNYSSQVLHIGLINGGYVDPLRTGNGTYDETDLTQWWYTGDEYSRTWAWTDWLYNYMRIYDTEFSFMANEELLEGGDFIFLDLRNNINEEILIPDGKADHMRVVVGNGSISLAAGDYSCVDPTRIPTESENTLLVNQHCVDRKHVAWDFNIDFNIHHVWYVHVTK